MANTPISMAISAGVSVASAKEAYDRVRAMNDEHLDELRRGRDKLRQDFARYDAADAESASKYQSDSVDAQIQALRRLADERKAFSVEARLLQAEATKAAEAGIDLEVALGEKGVQQLTGILQAKKRLFDEYNSNVKRARDGAAAEEEAGRKSLQEQLNVAAQQQKAEEEHQAKQVAQRKKGVDAAVSAASTLGSAFTKTSPDVPGSSETSNIGSNIAKIATAPDALGRILGVLQLVADAAIGLYAESKQITREQLAAAGGSVQLQRYINDPRQRAQAELIQAKLKYSPDVRAEDQSEIPKILAQLQKGGQGRVDLAAPDTEKGVVSLTRTAQILDVNAAQFARTLGEISRNTNQSFQEVDKAFLEAGIAINEYNKGHPQEQISQIQFTQHVNQMSEALKGQRFAAQDITATTLKWSKALDDGTVSTSQLAQAMKGFNNADSGALAYLAPGAIQRASKAAQGDVAKRYFETLSKKDVVSQQEGLRAGGQGVQGAPDIARILGMKPEDVSTKDYQEIQRLAGSKVREEANEKSRTLSGGNPFVQRSIDENLSKAYGVSLTGVSASTREALKKPVLAEPGAEGQVEEPRGGEATALNLKDVGLEAAKTAKGLAALNDELKGPWAKFVAATWGGAVIAHQEHSLATAQRPDSRAQVEAIKAERAKANLPALGPIDMFSELQKRRAATAAQTSASGGTSGDGTAGGPVSVNGEIKVSSEKAFEEALPAIKKILNDTFTKDQQRLWAEGIDAARRANAGAWDRLAGN